MRRTTHQKVLRFSTAFCLSMLSVWASGSDRDDHRYSDMGSMDWQDTRDLEFASRGFIGTRSLSTINSPQGRLVYDLNESAFVEEAGIDSIHPSLLRQARLLRRSGLFEVTEGVYQVRGFDITNITFLRGETGWIVVDPGLAPTSTRAAYELVTEHLGNRPISGIIYTHSHVDHFGGVAGLITQDDVVRMGIPVLAPEGFMEAVLDEFLINGVATHRRTEYAGIGIERGPQGTVSAGIADGAGKELWSLIPPNALVTDDTQVRTVDGIDIVFQLTPGTEAPAEMNLYLPQIRVLHMAENANVSLHNVLSPRGVVVRDAKAWADQLSTSIHRFADDSDAVVISHGWPRFGSEEIRDYLSKHRDAYKFLHDQTVRLMNEGLVPDEIANRLKLPDSLAREWYNRGYYGELSFNARAVYQRYLGWYQGNPIDLQPLEPKESSVRYVRAMGGANQVLEQAQQARHDGELQWAAELLNHLVIAHPDSDQAREELASVYSELALQQENGVWRAQYLSAAKELRFGVGRGWPSQLERAPILAQLSPSVLFEMLAVRLDPGKVGDASIVIHFAVSDRAEDVTVSVRHSVLTYVNDAAEADVSVTVTFADLVALESRSTVPDVPYSSERARQSVQQFVSWFTRPDGRFPIVWRPQ